MYGLLLDCIQKFLCERYGERYWRLIRRRAQLKNQWFVTHDTYNESIMGDLVDAAACELGEEKGTVMRMFGKYFAESIGHYGYARLLRVLGRDLRNFLNGLDDLHEYLRFSYPKMRPPSFFCENETEHGLLLHYTTRRSGFLEYVIGQLTTVGRIYGKDLEITLLSEEVLENGAIHMVMELKFDNSECLRTRRPSLKEKEFSIDSQTFLSVFPFCIFFDQDLVVWRVGTKLEEVLPDLVGMNLSECFSIHKPMFDALSYRMICLHANSVFELVSVSPVTRNRQRLVLQEGEDEEDSSLEESYQGTAPQLRLKGQMLALPYLEKLVFLCSPVMDSPEDLYESGIYVNDLSMHDSSRDIILAGSQKDPELNLAFNQEKIRSAQLEDSIQQTDQLLFQMMPKPIADQLRRGETPLNTCKEFSSVSILFSDIVSFTPMCSRLHPMEVVCVLNAMYVAYDQLCQAHHVYKVQTIGDGYMVLCGAPVYTVHHAEYITDFAMAIIKATYKINDPSTGESLKIRIGIHSGNVVAGVVGSNVLRYDVFGDTVNVAARMEATGEPMRVHVSETTAELLSGSKYSLHMRGNIKVKGKGEMKTYWVGEEGAGEGTPPLAAPVSDTPSPENSSHLSVPQAPPSFSVSLPPTLPPDLPSSGLPRPETPPPYSPSPELPHPLPRKLSKTPSPSPPPGLPHPHSLSPKLSEIASRPLSPKSKEIASRPPLSPSRLSHPLPPKPSEWPEAMQRLQKFSSMALDRSVPPGGKGRRCTAPPSQLSQDIDPSTASFLSNERALPDIPPGKTIPQAISLSKLDSALWNQQQLIGWPSKQTSSLSRSGSVTMLPLQPDPGEGDIAGKDGGGGGGGKDGDGGDKDGDGGIVMAAPPTSTQHFLEMEHFALQAEKNAKRAKELSDWANSIVHTLREEADHTHDVSDHTPRYLPEGTPVKGCPIGHLRGSGCPVDDPVDEENDMSPHTYCLIM